MFEESLVMLSLITTWTRKVEKFEDLTHTVVEFDGWLTTLTALSWTVPDPLSRYTELAK